jgi:hypothetical protein
MAGNSLVQVGFLTGATVWTHLSPSGVSRREPRVIMSYLGFSLTSITRGRLQQTSLGLG